MGGRWPGEPTLDLDRPLLLDDVVVTSLEGCGILQALVSAGAEIHVSSRTLEMAKAEITGQRRSVELERAIERVRHVISSALAAGRAKLGPFRRVRPEEGGPAARDLDLTPLTSLLRDGSPVDVLVSGDRMVNGYAHFTDEAGSSRPVATPLDVIDHLHRTGAIDSSRWTASRRRLREAGVALVPVESDEVFDAALAGDWRSGAPRPLRAIRDSIHLPIVRGAVSLPADRIWMEGVVMSLAHAIRSCWSRFPDVEVAATAVDWLFSIIPDVPGVPGADETEEDRAWSMGLNATMHVLLATPMNGAANRLAKYHPWWADVVEPLLSGRDRCVAPIAIARIQNQF